MRTHAVKLPSFAVGLLLVSTLALRADSITVVSDASTLGAALGPGTPSDLVVARLASGDVTGLTFQPVLVGAFGTFTPVPGGAPAGTLVVNLAPGDGESGFFEDTFTLPSLFSNPTLSGEGNVDDSGLVFLNGNLISAQQLAEFGDGAFSTSDASFFNAGVNVLLISDDNSGGGPSGTAFYATVNYDVASVPDSGTGLVSCLALVCLAMEFCRRRTLRWQ
jgi:hypothetical protein